MKRRDLWRLSVLNVFSSPVRSVLTVLGFAIGVAAILAVLTLGTAGKEQVENEMNRLGISKVWLTPEDNAILQLGMGDWLTQKTGADTNELIYLPVQYDNNEVGTAIACNKSYMNGVHLLEGRMFWNNEWSAAGQSALIGEKAAAVHRIELGECVNVSGRVFQVCGIIGGNGEVGSIALEDAVILPLKAAAMLTGGAIHEIQLAAPPGKTLEQTQSLALNMLERHSQQVSALNMQIQMDAASSVIFTFVNVLKWVALVCILVGGIGVMNMMLVNVRERRREIGIMKSMGTTQQQVCGLFLLEALMYAVIGGVLGVLLGVGLIGAAGRSIQLPAKANLADCTVVMLCALITGMVFGVAPAFRASRLSCVEALRQE